MAEKDILSKLYFISEANLFHDPTSSAILEKIEERINEFCSRNILCNWIVGLDNFILPVIPSCFKVERPLNMMPQYVEYFSLLSIIRKSLALESLEAMFTLGVEYSYTICRTIIKCGLSSGLRYLSPENYTTLNPKSHRQSRF